MSASRSSAVPWKNLRQDQYRCHPKSCRSRRKVEAAPFPIGHAVEEVDENARVNDDHRLVDRDDRFASRRGRLPISPCRVTARPPRGASESEAATLPRPGPASLRRPIAHGLAINSSSMSIFVRMMCIDRPFVSRQRYRIEVITLSNLPTGAIASTGRDVERVPRPMHLVIPSKQRKLERRLRSRRLITGERFRLLARYLQFSKAFCRIGAVLAQYLPLVVQNE